MTDVQPYEPNPADITPPATPGDPTATPPVEQSSAPVPDPTPPAPADASTAAPAITTAPQVPSADGSDAMPAPAAAPAAQVGDIVTYAIDTDDEDGPEVRGLVVGYVEGAEHRDEALLIVPLADAITVPLDAVKD